MEDEQTEQNTETNQIDNTIEQTKEEAKPHNNPHVVEKVVETEKQKEKTGPTIGTKIKSFLIECKRVLKVTRKPDKKEFGITVKVTALGILLIGLIGFIIIMIKQILVNLL